MNSSSQSGREICVEYTNSKNRTGLDYVGHNGETFLFSLVNKVKLLLHSAQANSGSGRMVTRETNLITILLAASLLVPCYKNPPKPPATQASQTSTVSYEMEQCSTNSWDLTCAKITDSLEMDLNHPRFH